MTIERLAEPCRRCGGPVYSLADWPERAKCSACGAGYVVTPREPRRLHRLAWQAVALLSASTVVLALAALGLALPPRVMLAVGIAGGLCVAAVGVWIMAGALYDSTRE